MNITEENTLFKKMASHVFTYESDPLKSQVGYCLVRRNQWKFLKDIKVLPREPKEECITRLTPLLRVFKMRKVNTKRRFALTRNILKLHEDNVKNDSGSYINKHRASSRKDAYAEVYRRIMKEALLEAT